MKAKKVSKNIISRFFSTEQLNDRFFVLKFRLNANLNLIDLTEQFKDLKTIVNKYEKSEELLYGGKLINSTEAFKDNETAYSFLFKSQNEITAYNFLQSVSLIDYFKERRQC